MAASDRLYEVACECRDMEESCERVARENRELSDRIRRYEVLVKQLRHICLVEISTGGLSLPAGAASLITDLSALKK